MTNRKPVRDRPSALGSDSEVAMKQKGEHDCALDSSRVGFRQAPFENGTSTCYRAWRVNPEKSVLAGTVVEMFSRCLLLCKATCCGSSANVR